jgi:hypothetical protein
VGLLDWGLLELIQSKYPLTVALVWVQEAYEA